MPLSGNKGPTLRSGRMLSDSNSDLDIVLNENSDQLRGATGQTNDVRDDPTRPKTHNPQLDDPTYPELCGANILDRTQRCGGDILNPQDRTGSHNPTNTTTMSAMDRYLLNKLAEVLVDDNTESTKPSATYERSNQGHMSTSQDPTTRRNGMGFRTNALPSSRVHRLRPERSFEQSRDPERRPIPDHSHFLNTDLEFERPQAYQRRTNDYTRRSLSLNNLTLDHLHPTYQK
jgi:hypothetical protein